MRAEDLIVGRRYRIYKQGESVPGLAKIGDTCTVIEATHHYCVLKFDHNVGGHTCDDRVKHGHGYYYYGGRYGFNYDWLEPCPKQAMFTDEEYTDLLI